MQASFYKNTVHGVTDMIREEIGVTAKEGRGISVDSSTVPNEFHDFKDAEKFASLCRIDFRPRKIQFYAEHLQNRYF